MGYTSELLTKINNTNSISIHYRRTDYCNLGLTISDTGYYQKALNLLLQKIESPEIFIFSDDLVWAKSNVKFPFPVTFVFEPDYIEMFLMSQCKHNIIANSTFSWWAAWLNSNSEKIVVAPKSWHNKKANTKIYPAEWTVI